MPRKGETIYMYIQEKAAKKSENVQVSGLMPTEDQKKNVNNIINIAWSKWRETTGVMCDRNIPTKLKNKVYKTASKPAMVY